MGTHLGTHLEWPGYLRNKLGRVSRVRSAIYLYNKLLVGVLPQLVVRINDIDHDIRVDLLNRRGSSHLRMNIGCDCFVAVDSNTQIIRMI